MHSSRRRLAQRAWLDRGAHRIRHRRRRSRCPGARAPWASVLDALVLRNRSRRAGFDRSQETRLPCRPLGPAGWWRPKRSCRRYRRKTYGGIGGEWGEVAWESLQGPKGCTRHHDTRRVLRGHDTTPKREIRLRREGEELVPYASPRRPYRRAGRFAVRRGLRAASARARSYGVDSGARFSPHASHSFVRFRCLLAGRRFDDERSRGGCRRSRFRSSQLRGRSRR